MTKGTSRGRAAPDARPRNARAALLRLLRYAAAWKAELYALAAVTLLSIAADIASPLLIERCIDALAPRGSLFSIRVDAAVLLPPLIAFVLLSLISALLGYFHGVLAARLSLNLEAKLRLELVEKILRIPLRCAEDRRAGDLMSRVMNDATLAAKAFSDALLALFASCIMIAGSGAVMFAKNATLAAASVGATMISVVLVALVSGFLLPAILARQTSLGAMNMHIEESLYGFSSCVAGNRQRENLRRMERCGEDYYQKSVRAAALEGALEPLMLVLGNLNFLLIVVFGARLALRGAVGLGTLQAFILYSKQFMEPVSELGENFTQVQNALAGAERVFELLDTPDEHAEPTFLPEKSRRAEPLIRFEDVRFSYRRNHPILNGVELCVEQGETLALVGVTGAGKTTLVSLLARLYDGYEGGIYLDGRELHGYALPELRRRITVVPQEPCIIDGTIYENLTYGLDHVSEARVREMAEAVGLGYLIEQMPDGYDTRLSRGGETLSQGQMQLICLARAMLREPEILILDESTSSVDAVTEQALKRGTRASMRGRTGILIAHRLASAADADHICVLQDGVIAEYGTHRQLLALGGLYRTLFDSQFAGKEI